MANYTVTLGSLIENNVDIGLKNYPIYKEEYRTPLNNLIKEHFYFREIGLETSALFIRLLNRKMNEIMPYYNQMYKSESIDFNPLYNIEMYETLELNKTNTSTATGSNTTNTTNTNTTTNSGSSSITGTNTGTNNTSISSTVNKDSTNTLTKNTQDLKQTINYKDNAPVTAMTENDILNNNYASEIERSKDTINNTGTDTNVVDETVTTTETNNNTVNLQNTENGTTSNTLHISDEVETIASNSLSANEIGKDTYSKKTWGASAGYSYSQLIQQWRKIMVNINMQIIEELEPLFMQIY